MKSETTVNVVARGVGHQGVLSALATGLLDLVGRQRSLPELGEDVRLDGKTCLVTGASSGLGKAVATELARRGGQVIMVCRSGTPEARESVRLSSGSEKVELLQADLSDLTSVTRLCDTLRDRRVRLDIAVMNAGLMPRHARKTAQGYEEMFVVHFLSNRLMLARWLADGVVAVDRQAGSRPRLIFVSSEAHRSAPPIDFERFGEFADYGLKDGMKHYGATKLHLTTFVQELDRRINVGDEPRVVIHSLCPGPIASNIARESPAYIKPFLTPLMKLLFRSPEQAAGPVIYLACAPEMGRESGVYLHMSKRKQVCALASNPDNGQQLWAKSEALLDAYSDAQTQRKAALW